MDLTTGHPLKQLLLFSLPLVAGTLFQPLPTPLWLAAVCGTGFGFAVRRK